MDPYLADEYRARINRVQDYIEIHLAEELTLATLANVAGFSKYHFNRVFHSICGETLFQFIQRVRAERAATLLLYHTKRSITEIALDCGFSSSALFARVFKQYFGVPASRWRSVGGSDAADPEFDPGFGESRTTGIGIAEGSPAPVPMTVSVRDLPEIPVVYVRYVGEFQANQELFEDLYGRLFRWAGARDLYEPGVSRVFCLVHDNPALTDAQKLRVSCCLSVSEDVVPDGEVGRTVIPGGRYACAECYPRVDQYGAAWGSLFRDWLPNSGYQPDDGLAFEEYPMEDAPNSPGTEPRGGSGGSTVGEPHSQGGGTGRGGDAAGPPSELVGADRPAPDPQRVLLWLPVRPL